MKKLLSLLSVLTISGTAMPTTIAASPYQKETNSEINYSQVNNLEKLNRSKRQYGYSYVQYPSYNQYPSYQQNYNNYGYDNSNDLYIRKNRTIFIAPELQDRRININDLVIGTNLGEFIGVPDSNSILDRLYQLYPSLEFGLRQYLNVTIRQNYWMAYISVDESSGSYRGEIALHFRPVVANENINNLNIPQPNHNEEDALPAQRWDRPTPPTLGVDLNNLNIIRPSNEQLREALRMHDFISEAQRQVIGGQITDHIIRNGENIGTNINNNFRRIGLAAIASGIGVGGASLAPETLRISIVIGGIIAFGAWLML